MGTQFLYLTNSQLVAMVAQGKRIAERREFAVTAAGAAQFEAWLALHASMPVRLFTDLAEEDFRLDAIPHVGSRDRDAILARKLAQMFRNTPFRHAVVQGRESEGRRDDRVLYTAITNPEVLRPWLDAIERLNVPLGGIYSAAVFSSTMLEALDLLFPHTLLVTFTPGGAMRQTYFKDREIKFSRLTPIDPEEGQSLGTLISEETSRTWQYLDSLRHFGENDRLEVCVLLHSGDRLLVQPSLRDFAQIQHHILEMEQVAAKLGIRPAPASSTAEEVFVYLFLARPGRNHFASLEMRRFDTLRRTRLGLRRAAAATFAACIAWGGWNLYRALETSDQDQHVAREMTTLNQQYDQITRSTPSLGVGGTTMRDSVAFYNAWIRGFPRVTDFMVALSQVWARHPEMRLGQLAWIATDDPKAMPVLGAPLPSDAPPVKAVESQRQQARGSEAPAFAGGRYEVALVEGTVRVASNDFRDALGDVNRLAQELEALPGTHAEVVESPLDTSSTVQIQGRHEGGEPDTMQPRFVLRVVRDHGGGAS
ncbi:MAG TPA: hypothetical protein VN782_05085 [Usitatibacter sp.]|nr:hypothetical protein [Usitatibacter sp.]